MTLHFKYNAIFDEWRLQSIDILSQGFRKQLEASDAVLVEFADKAENINIQNRFYDAQREIWLKMDDIAQCFRVSVGKYLTKTLSDDRPGKKETEQETLDLLNIDIYEKSLALKSLAGKSVIENQHALYSLQQRIAVINGGLPVKLENIPGAPEQVCEAFSQCIDRLNLKSDALMVLYTLFDKYVLSLLPEIYSALNQQLIQMGILPTLKYQVKIATDVGVPPKPEQPPALIETAPSTEQDQNPSELGIETLTRIKDLLAANRAIAGIRKPLPPGVESAPADEIINTLGSIQENQETTLPAEVEIDSDIDPVKVDRPLLDRVQSTLLGQRQKVKQMIGRDRLNDQQENAIDIVGMLFEQVLDHETLSGSAKALLAHLHTPYIKVGLQDESFFIDPKHAAREFLNQAIEASISLVNEKDLTQGIYPQLKAIVHQIVKFNRYEQQDFVEFEGQLGKEVERLSTKAQLLEKRVQEAEKGKSRLMDAKTKARLSIEEVFAGQKMTEHCKEFLNEVWIDYLALILLRNQCDMESPEWKASQELARQLLNVTQEACGGTVEQTKIEQLFTSLKAQVGRLLPHQVKAIERFIQSVGSTQPSTATVDTKPRSTEPKTCEQVDSNMYLELRALQANTLFQFHKDAELSIMAKLSWYNKHTDRFLFVDQAGRKFCLKSTAELATEISQDKTAYFPTPKRSFWDTAISTISKLLDK